MNLTIGLIAVLFFAIIICSMISTLFTLIYNFFNPMKERTYQFKVLTKDPGQDLYIYTQSLINFGRNRKNDYEFINVQIYKEYDYTVVKINYKSRRE